MPKTDDADVGQPLDDHAGENAFSPRSRAPSVWRYVVPIALALIIVMVFMTALDAGLVYWDDDDLLVNNTRYQTLSGENLKWMFTTSYAGHFQPLTWLTYSLDYAIWGMEPVGFHLTNVLFHALTAVSFYFLTRMLLTIAMGTAGLAHSRPFVLSAACAAALFALHPLRAESVAWLAERRDVVSGFFYVLAVACYVRYASSYGGWHGQTCLSVIASEPTDKQVCRCHPTGATLPDSSVQGVATPFGGPAGTRWRWYIGALASCILSLLAKASAMTLPVVLLILDVYPLRRLGGAMGWRGRSAARVWLEKLPLFVLALAAGARAIVAQAQGGGLTPYDEHNLLARIAQACYGLAFYIWKTLWPTNLGPLYDIPRLDILLGPQLWLSIILVAGLAVVAFVWRRRFPAIATALATYVVILAPVLGFAQSGPQMVADRYSYLSCMGFAVLAGGGVLLCFRRRSWWALGHRRAVLGVLLAGVIAVLQFATFAQADIWQSPLQLWHRGVTVSPNSSIAHVNYADALVDTERFAAAAEHYQRGLEIDPDDPVALHHFADLLQRFGEKAHATAYYMRALRIDPTRRRACYHLAQLFVDQGRAHDAVAVLRDGVRRHPRAWEIIEYLALMLSSHPDDTIRNGEEALELASRASRAKGPTDARALLAVATALAEVSRFDEAVETAERALVIAERNDANLLAKSVQDRLELFRARQPYRLNQ